MFRALCLWTALVAVAASPALASESPPESPLALAVEAAWLRAAAAAEAEGRVQVASAAERASRAWSADAPTLEVRNFSGDWGDAPGVRESEVGLASPVWLPGQRSAGRRAALAEVAAAHAGEDLARLQIAGEVREALWDLALRRAQHVGTTAEVGHLRALAADARRRVAAGEAAKIEALAIEAEQLAAESAAAEAEVEFETAARRWALLTGLPAPSGTLDLEPAPAAAASVDVDVHPEVRAAAHAAERARAQLQFARRAPAAAPEVAVLFREDVGGQGEPTERSVGVGLSVPFGGPGRSAERRAIAAGELSVAERTALRTREAVADGVVAARTALAAAERRHAAEQTRRELLLERLAHLEKSYAAGETALAELLRERVTAAQAVASAESRRASLGLARARLHQASGTLP